MEDTCYYTHLHQRKLLVKKLLRLKQLQAAVHLKKHKAAKEDSSDKVKDGDSDDTSSVADTNDSEATSASAAVSSGNQTAQPA